MNAQSKFVLGAKVAIVNTHYQRSISGPRFVGKVHKDGKFFLTNADGTISTTMWTPGKHSGDTARQSGERSWSRDYLEIWTESHDAEIAKKKEALVRGRRVLRLKNLIDGSSASTYEELDAILDAVEAVPAYATLAPVEEKKS